MEQIRNSAIPDAETVFSRLSRHFDLGNAVQPFLRAPSILHRYELAIDLAALETVCRAVVAQYRLRGFRNTADDNDHPALWLAVADP